jgi:peptide/nickel transport system ATP-binding protein
VRDSPVDLLRDVAFSVEPSEILGLVGESGSGKTVASLALMGILPPALERRAGEVSADPSDLAMIFQHPRAALNPTMRVGRQIARIVRLTEPELDRKRAAQRAVATLSRVGIPGAARVAEAYPHQLSGGMCQRVMIAMALSRRPRLLIADEPTTALDVTIQAQIFDLIRDLVAETGAGVIFITHDLAAVAEMCDRVAVLYGGQVMEMGDKLDVLTDPAHPYTRFLLDAIERDVDPRVEEKPVNFALTGCRFAERCPHAFADCVRFPPLFEVSPGHVSSCFLHVREKAADADR